MLCCFREEEKVSCHAVKTRSAQKNLSHTVATRSVKRGCACDCRGSKHYLLANTCYCHKLNNYFTKMPQCDNVFCCIEALIRIKPYVKW